MFWVHVVGEIGRGLHGLALVGGPRPLVVMEVPGLHDVNLVLVHQIFQVKGQSSHVGVLHVQRGIEGPVDSHDDPLDVGVVARIPQVLLEVVELLATQVVGVFGGEVDHVHLPVVEGEPEIGLFGTNLRQDIALHVGSVVVVPLVVAHSRHERGIGCELLGQLSKEVPHWLQLTCLLVAGACVGDVPCEEDEVVGSDEVVLHYLVDDERAKGSVGAHIPKHGQVHLFQRLHLQRRRSEVFGLGEDPGLCVSHSVEVSLERFQALDDCAIYSAVEAQVTHIVGDPRSFHHFLQLSGQPPKLHYWFIVELRSGDPHYLHFPLDVGESNVDLLGS